MDSPDVPAEDKAKIMELLKKPWNPYIRRHSAITENGKYLKESILKQHAGWSPNSNMHLKYLHYFGNESNESLLEAYGLKPKFEQIDKLKPVQCPHCNEQNKIGSKFCSKCKMILTYDEYVETLEKQKQKQDKIELLEKQVNENTTALNKLIDLIDIKNVTQLLERNLSNDKTLVNIRITTQDKDNQ